MTRNDINHARSRSSAEFRAMTELMTGLNAVSKRTMKARPLGEGDNARSTVEHADWGYLSGCNFRKGESMVCLILGIDRDIVRAAPWYGADVPSAWLGGAL